MGERSPHNDPNARGTFIGMTMDTTRADMTQAVLEGVAFALRDSLRWHVHSAFILPVPVFAVEEQRVRYGRRLWQMCSIFR